MGMPLSEPERMLAVAELHGFSAYQLGGAVVLELPYTRLSPTGELESGIESVACRTVGELRAVLGY